MSFNISGIVVSGNHQEHLQELEQNLGWSLEYVEDITFETASENWKKEGICDIYFSDNATLMMLNMDLCLLPMPINGLKTLVFALSETSEAFNLAYCEDEEVVRSIMQVEANVMSETGEPLAIEDSTGDVSKTIWKQLEAVLGKSFYSIQPEEKAKRFRLTEKPAKVPIKQEPVEASSKRQRSLGIQLEEVELIILSLTLDGEHAINMKVYKNGLVCRNGMGAFPSLKVSGMCETDDSKYFDHVIKKVPQEILDQPLQHEEPTPNGALEYVIAFYGVTTNADHGERANWSKSTGVKIRLDQQSRFNHAIMSLIDGLIIEAAEVTNELYFDMYMQARFGLKSALLPDQTIIVQPKSQIEIKQDYIHYTNQVSQSARAWKLSDYYQDKQYEKGGESYRLNLELPGQADKLTLTPVTQKKPWWKFW